MIVFNYKHSDSVSFAPIFFCIFSHQLIWSFSSSKIKHILGVAICFNGKKIQHWICLLIWFIVFIILSSSSAEFHPPLKYSWELICCQEELLNMIAALTWKIRGRCKNTVSDAKILALRCALFEPFKTLKSLLHIETAREFQHQYLSAFADHVSIFCLSWSNMAGAGSCEVNVVQSS